MRKQDSKELIRMQNIIENDRLNVGKGFSELLLSDLHKLFIDYFDYSGLPQIDMVKEKGQYKVSVVIYPSRIKAFNVVVED